MKSYWLVRYSFRYNDKEGNLVEIIGNSVHEFEGQSFMPGSVRKTIDNYLVAENKNMMLDSSQSCIILEGFGRIDKQGFDDFKNEDSICANTFYLSRRKFIHRKSKSSVTISVGAENA